jgi:Tol biopolymer transport system component
LWEVHVDSNSGLPTTKPVQITHTPDFTYLRPTATDDGKRVVVQVNRVRIDVVAAEFDQTRAEIRNLHRAVFTDTDNLPTGWTNSGDAILFEAAHGLHTGIYRQTLDRQDAEDFETRSNADILQALPSPDGAFLLYLPYMDGHPDTSLMRVPATGGTPQPLFTAHSSLNWFKCSRAPTKVCVLTDLTPAGLQLTAFDPARGQTLRQFSMPATPAPQSWDLSQDGTRIVTVDRSGGSTRLRLFDLTTGAAGAVALDGLDGVEFVAWAGRAADGWIVTRRSGTRGGEVLHVTTDGQRKSIWSSAFQKLGRPTPSPDGRTIAFSSFMFESCAWMLQGF